jgi:hypothetical protein
VGQHGGHRLELRVDLDEGSQGTYRPLNLVSGDLFRDVGGGELEHRYSFLLDHPTVAWPASAAQGAVVIDGALSILQNGAGGSGMKPLLKATIPLVKADAAAQPAMVQIVQWGSAKTSFECNKVSDYLRTIDLEIDRVSSTELPRAVETHSLAQRPQDLPALALDVSQSYRRAGIDMRLISDSQVFSSVAAGADLVWDDDELHHAMEHHFSQWRDSPQWKVYLLVATHYKLYPFQPVTGMMYDSEYRDPTDPFPRQGAAVFYSTMAMTRSGLTEAEFDRNYLRTCVHELGHTLNLLHSFDKDRPESPSWMNYPWRYPYGFNLPSGWDGTPNYWQDFRFEFDAEELRHMRHDALHEVIPGGSAFGSGVYDLPMPAPLSAQQQAEAPVALYVRTRPERTLFRLAEPVTVELKLKNQTDHPVIVPDMLNPEFGLVQLFIRDPKGKVRPFQPLFRLCAEARIAELPPGEKLYESAFVTFGAKGFTFEEPGEYQIWAVYGAGGLRLRSNLLRIRVAYPQSQGDEQIALRTFGREQGLVLTMRGAQHLQSGTDQLREVAERWPDSNLARYIHYCFGSSQAREFKDLVNNQIRAPRPEVAARELERARTFAPDREKYSALDNLTHGRAVELLADLYLEIGRPEQAHSVLMETARYFRRMKVKPEVVEGMRRRAASIKRGR